MESIEEQLMKQDDRHLENFEVVGEDDGVMAPVYDNTSVFGFLDSIFSEPEILWRVRELILSYQPKAVDSLGAYRRGHIYREYVSEQHDYRYFICMGSGLLKLDKWVYADILIPYYNYQAGNSDGDFLGLLELAKLRNEDTVPFEGYLKTSDFPNESNDLADTGRMISKELFKEIGRIGYHGVIYGVAPGDEVEYIAER